MFSLIRIFKNGDTVEKPDYDFSEDIRIFTHSKIFSIREKGNIKEIKVKSDPGFIRLFDIASLISDQEILIYLSNKNISSAAVIKQAALKISDDKGLFCVSLSTDELPRLIYKKKYGILTYKWIKSDFKEREDVPFFNNECFALSKKIFYRLGGFSTGFLKRHLHDIDISIRARKKGYRISLINSRNVSRIDDKKFLFDTFYRENNQIALNFRHLKRRDKIRNIAFTLKDTPSLLKQKRFETVTGRFHGLVKNAKYVD